MQYKTSNVRFEKYGSVYDRPINRESSDMICREGEVSVKECITVFNDFDCDVYIEVTSGIAALIVSELPEADACEAFAIHRNVRLKPHVFFQVAAINSTVTYRLITEKDFISDPRLFSPGYHFKRVLPKVRVKELLGYYYSIRDSGYCFAGESHPYFELTYVDHGTLTTEVDGKTYEVKERELMIYGPGQFHTQKISLGSSCSYVTILFELESPPEHFEYLLNKVFPYSKSIYKLMHTLVNESSTFVPYMDSLLACLFEEIIIRLLQTQFQPPSEAEQKSLSFARENHQNELLDQILDYINETIREPITVGEICDKFSMSRSTLQIMFNEHLNQTPKKYINELKLEMSRQLLSEDRFSVSEIALIMGFNSIHYFSRAFAQKYKMSPTEYAKTLCKEP